MPKPLSEYRRTYLDSLEVEFGLDAALTELSILAQGLFSPQVCLIDSHIVDNQNVLEFFISHERDLLGMMADLETYELPLIGTCSRGKADCWKTLDVMLKPRDGNLPRVASLSPARAKELALGYAKLGEDERREKFLQAKGADRNTYVKYLDVASKYFQSAEALTVIAPHHAPDSKLYEETTTVIEFLRRECPDELTDEDQRTCDALLAEMSRNTDALKTRQRLHSAIYGEKFPPDYQGIVAWYDVGLAKDHVKDEWRYLINQIFNQNLAMSFGLSPAQDCRPKTTRFQNVFRRQLEIEKEGLVKLASTIYPQYLSFDFVRSVRKQEQFWKNLSNPDPIIHRQYIAEEFKKHLISLEVTEYVGEQWREKIVLPLKTARLYGPPIIAGLAILHGLYSGSSIESVGAQGLASYAGAEAGINRAVRGIEDYFSTGRGRTKGDKWSYVEGFRTFADNLANVTLPV
jgi:hypothetical protein